MEVSDEQFKPIEKSFEPKTRIPEYSMHMYWSRKPYNVTAEYIRHFTKKGEIVLDPFCGNGVTNLEALKLRRKTVANDLNPLATFIVRMLSFPADLDSLEKAFGQIEKKTKDRILALYETKCKRCGSKAIALYTVWDKRLNKNIIRKIRYKCNHCKSNSSKKADEADERKVRDIEKMKIPFWYPRTKMIWNARQHVYEDMKVTDLFTKRNLIALTMLFDEIQKLPSGRTKDFIQLAFTSELHLVSKATHEGGGQVLGFFWVPADGSLERNVWYTFEKRFEKIMKGKRETNNSIGNFCKEAKSFAELKQDKTCMFITGCANKMARIPDNVVDYILTDPPYADEVPYLEISLFWVSWLGLEPTTEDFEKEIILSDSPLRPAKKNKTMEGEENYAKLLGDALKESYRVLRDGRWMSVWFHNRDLKIWNMLINLAREAGFELVNLVYQPHSTVTFKQVGTNEKAGTVRGHFILNFRKPIKHVEHLPKLEVGVEELIVRTAQKVIAEGDGANLSEIYQGVIPELVKFGVLHEIVQIQDDLAPVLKKHFDQKDGRWYIKEEDFNKLGHYIPLSSRLRLFIPSILKRLGPATIDQIYKELLPLLRNAKTPDEREIADTLKGIAEPTADGRWKMKKPKTQAPLAPFLSNVLPELPNIEATHEQIIYALAKLGQYAGCSVWIGKKEQAAEFETEKFSRLSIASLPQLGGIPEEARKIIEQIDVLWLKGNVIIGAFEVEHTTGVVTGLARFNDLLNIIPNIKMDMYIIAPDDREKKVIQELNRPAIRATAKKSGWKYVLYSDLLKKYDVIRKEQLKIRPEMIKDIAKGPF